MGLFSMARASASSSALEEMIRSVYGGSTTSSGITVNTESSLKVGAVYTCVLVLSQSVAQLPLHLFERTTAGNIQNSDHPLANVVCDSPNDWMTDFDMIQLIMVHLCLRGNSVWLPTKWPGGKQVRELIPIHPDRIIGAEQDEKYRIFLKVENPKTKNIDTIPYDKVLHFKGMSTNGFWGLNPIQYAREIIALSIATEKHGAKLFANGAKMGGILVHPHKMKEQAANNLINSFNERVGDIENAHKTVLLEEGVKFEKITMTAEDAQFLESRKFQRSEIAGWFRVPSHLINDLEKATFSNVEHLDLAFVKHALAPYLVSIEKRFRKVLMTDADKKKYFFKFNVDGLLRGDIKSRYEAMYKAVGGPWLTVNEVREVDDHNSIDGGDELLKPMNMGAPADEPATVT